MSAGAASRTIRAPGRLVVGPTNLTAAFPYGGVQVGRSKLVVLRSLGVRFRVEAEGTGDATDVLESNQHYVLSCFLRGFDDDAVRLLFPYNYANGAVTGHSLLDVPASDGPGISGYARRQVILYVPDNVVDHPSLLVYAGIADWSDSVEVAFQRKDELGLPIAVECLRDEQQRILKLGRLADLVL